MKKLYVQKLVTKRFESWWPHDLLKVHFCKSHNLEEPTVDGRNPKQPPDMYETLYIMGFLTGSGFLPSTVGTSFANVGIGNPLNSTDSYFIGLENVHLFWRDLVTSLGVSHLVDGQTFINYCGIYTTYLTMKKQVLNYKFHGSLTSFKRNTRVEIF